MQLILRLSYRINQCRKFLLIHLKFYVLYIVHAGSSYLVAYNSKAVFDQEDTALYFMQRYKASLYYDIYRIISPEQGKTLADSWRAVFVESSAKENKVFNTLYLSFLIANTKALSAYLQPFSVFLS